MKTKQRLTFLLPGLDSGNVADFYKMYFDRWRFDNSDEVFLDGKLLSDEEKFLIRISAHAGSGEVESSDKQNGIPLSESRFVTEEITRFEKILTDTTGVGEERILNHRAELYLDFLKKKRKGLKHIGGQSQKENAMLEDFFTDEASQELIAAIQERFKDLRGKKMAVLIYLLDKKHSLISLDNNHRKANSRIHLVRALTSTNVKNINGINNYFHSVTGETKVNEKDEAYLSIDKQLDEMVSNG